MTDEFKAESLVTEATDMRGAAKIYYTLAVEKIRDVCGSVSDETVCVWQLSAVKTLLFHACHCYIDFILLSCNVS